MRSRLVVAAGAAWILFCLPGFALETVTIPQPNNDGSPSYQDPDAQNQSKFSTDQQGNMKVDGLGSFHFSVSSGDGWNSNMPGNYYHSNAASQPGYGTSNAPGSEFYNSGFPFPH